MTIDERRQAIREGLVEAIREYYRSHYAHFLTERQRDAFADTILAFLAENGAVLKVEGVPKWFIFKWVGKQPDKILLDDIGEARLTTFAPLVEK